MTDLARVRRKQIWREAEGYLDLATACSDRLHLRPDLRDRLATLTLRTLDRLEDPNRLRVETYYLRGQAYRLMEKHSEAVVELEQAAKIDPENVHIWLALGWCHKRTNRLDLAIEALEEALSVDSEHAIIYYNLACYWSLARNTKLSVEFLARAFDMDPAFRDLVHSERDFDPIRRDPRFLELTTVIV